MKHRALRLFAIAVACVALVGGIFAAWLALQPGATDFLPGEHPIELSAYKGTSPTGVPPELAGASLIDRGKYLAIAADCKACHTVPGGTPFAGGRAFALPFGTLYTPNITPDKETGIGTWSDADFLRAVHRGISKNGERLYPAFPYGSYALLADADVLAIKAYLFSLPPVHRETIPNTFAFPFNQRWTMVFWSTLFVPDSRFKPVQERSQQWNRGAYLVEAAAHCAECHSPRNVAFAMDTRKKFAGGVAEGWNAYNITSDAESGIGGWSSAQLADYLSGKHASGVGTGSGPMGEAIDLSLSQLTASDIAAMVAYLRTVPPIHDGKLPRPAGPPATSVVAAGAPNSVGRRIFEGACASCHDWSGAGATLPHAALTGVRAVNDASAINVARMVLSGSQSEGTGRPLMPAFDGSLSDAEIAEVTNFVTARFGATPSHMSAKDVAKLRDGG